MQRSAGDTIKQPMLLWKEKGIFNIEIQLPSATSNLLFFCYKYYKHHSACKHEPIPHEDELK